ncbi:phosphatidylinositol-specific phospholipase C1-like protein [Zhouia sp. PK063]|uniref:phosphatidylinositol-specific phospholipase C1-like protein n=1 Tax=Zhouia sp. PK063 TaxID=3373602 RepID=UPI0037B9156B
MKLNVLVLTVFLGLTLATKAQNSQLHINQIQVIGSHNSYKKAINPKLFKLLAKKDTTKGIYSLQYEHIPIIDQLNMGLRNLELDAYADEKGGRFSHPKGLELVKDQPTYDVNREMDKPGFKMLHVLDIDFRSDYYTLAACLKDLKKWSKAHPNHQPIFITLEPKDGKANMFGTTPEPFTTKVFDDLDTCILQNLGKNHIITPDDVRGKYITLEEAVLHHNWPTLEQAQGKFLFILDAHGKKQALYAKNHPSLKNRVLFINAEPGTAEAAAMIINNPEDERISTLVKKGYIIRTRADANTKEARTNDYSHFKAAKKSGAQIITTDYYLSSKLFKSTYHINFDNKTFIRINPISVK